MQLNHEAKVVTLDIETAPIKGKVWGLWKNNVALNQIASDWFLLSFCAHWMGEPEDKVIYDDLRGEVDKEDDTRLLHQLWDILNRADIVVTQNGVAFDQKKINARFLLNGFPPPSPYKSIDTKLMACQKFAFTSNKLEYFTENFPGIKHKKLKHNKYPGMELWNAVARDELDAWEEMRVYNINDVLGTEEVYLIMRGWIDGHPNVNVYSDDTTVRCHRCGSDHIVRRGSQYTDSGRYQRFRCMSCGGWSRSRYTENSMAKRKSLLR